MGKEVVVLAGYSNPEEWTAARLADYIKNDFIFLVEGQYRGDPQQKGFLLEETQKDKIVELVTAVWQAKTVEDLATFAQEHDQAVYDPNNPPVITFENRLRDDYATLLNLKLEEKEAVKSLKEMVIKQIGPRKLAYTLSRSPTLIEQTRLNLSVGYACDIMSNLVGWQPLLSRPSHPNYPL